MIIEKAKNIFEIEIVQISEWKRRPHKHNFFEIVLVEEGLGLQCINEHEFKFEKGNVFLLPPLDCHSFKISEPSTFYFIRFTDHYFLDESKLENYSDWFDKMAYVLANYNKVPGDIINTDRERAYIIQTIKSIYQEYVKADAYSDSIISGAMSSILNILARSIENHYVSKANEQDSKFGELLRFINLNITNSEYLNISYLANKFNISKNYFSEYFKKQSGVSFLDYIMKSKLKLVESKIMHTDLTLKEIAYQLAFTDSSHLSRNFKKNYGITVKEFKANGHQYCS